MVEGCLPGTMIHIDTGRYLRHEPSSHAERVGDWVSNENVAIILSTRMIEHSFSGPCLWFFVLCEGNIGWIPRFHASCLK